ncbi:GNAT family N-acetyltransferase [Natronomonas marina]|jgi:N-acetylglutamate synthase-like GNAT family acetyltransferase/Asp-tRNA(Asn)/Glu-tRNA(Gln) amidotransferase C subunit|uniref:GNAT family N-acetyltransferase n=1 Tax=Natronomonas marina TaxID=2961939 RepID=UPI0020C9D50A|nr:GNAT family N-acetyltransferase [Natronomonas marina]
MQFSDELEFSHRDRKDIYEYIERYGTVDYEDARRALNMSPEAFGHHVAVLRRDGVVSRTEADDLQVAFEDDSEETFVDEGLEVTIRQAREDDLTGLVGAIREALSEETYIEGETIADVVESEDVLLRHNEVQSRVFFVATVHGDVVGWVHVNAPEIEKLAHTAELTVGVIDEYREHGIGTKLLDRGVDWALDNDFEKLYNSVPSTNGEAIEFLEERGWDTEAVREDHYKIGAEYVDEVMLAKRLG